MATISSPGINSGLDISSIVTQLVAIEKASLTTLQSKASSIQTKLSAYGTIKSQVSTLGDAATKLTLSTGWNAVKGSSSNSNAVGMTASAGAQATSLTMEVQQLAKAQSTASSAVASGASVGSGTMSIELGSWASGSFVAGSETPASITIDSGSDTLAEIATKINGAKGGVTATVITDTTGQRLLLRSDATGEENGFRVTVADDDGNDTDGSGLSQLAYDTGLSNGTSQTQGGKNALATINGVSIVSASNTLKDTLPNMKFQLSQVTTSPVELTVVADTDTIKANVKAFVDAYNTLSANLKTFTKYDETTKKSGALQGDSSAVGLQNAMRAMMRSVTDSSPYTRLSDVGIEVQTGGTLKIDDSKFGDALTDLSGLRSLFDADTGNASTQGFGLKLKAFTDALNDTDGLMSIKTEGFQAQIARNTDDQERVTDRASRVETRLLAQYNAMDARVGSLNTISTFLTAQIALWNQ
jgi:flagellar hook-associated protein 2